MLGFKLWNTASGRELLTLRADGFNLNLHEAFFSEDGHHIWAGLDQDGQLWGWDATPESKKP